MGERKNDNANDDLKNIDDFPGEPKQTRLREADHRDGRLDEDQGQIQRSGHTPGGKDLSRGSEPSTGAASRHRRLCKHSIPESTHDGRRSQTSG